MHHVPLPDAAKLIREHRRRAGSPRARAAGTPCATSPATPTPGSPTTSPSTSLPTAAAYVRYFVRHPTAQAMPRKFKTAFTATDADRAIVGIHDLGFIPRLRDGVRGVEMVVGGGTSIMPRVAPTLYEFVELDNGDYLKVTEAILRIFDRQEWLRVNRARARIKVLVDKIGIDAFREMVEEELEGDWVGERDFTIDRLAALRRRGGKRAGDARGAREPERRAHRVRALRRLERSPPAAGGLLDRGRQGRARRPHPRAAARPGGDHARLHGRVRAHDRASRTWCCAGCATSRSTTSGPVSASLASASRAPTRSPTSFPARAPTRASSASRARWG